MFATRIENGIPTIEGGEERVDDLETDGFYKRWKTDFRLATDMAIRFLRYGPPLHTPRTGVGQSVNPFGLHDLRRNIRKAGQIRGKGVPSNPS